MNRYMVIETFRKNSFEAVYQRYNQQGRLLPKGLYYIDSWVSADQRRCFQLMETDDAGIFDQWISQWNDLVDFEIIALTTIASG